MYYSAHYSSFVGPLFLTGSEKGLVGLWLEGQKYFGGSLPEKPEEREDHPVLMMAVKWLDQYFSGERPAISELPLAPMGSQFRQNIWKLLCGIPYGEVATYGELAKKAAAQLGRTTMSAQAVGGAVAHNPISIIIPCHRLVGTDGSLTGYAGGLDKKLRLLELEGVDLSRLHVPTKGTAL